MGLSDDNAGKREFRPTTFALKNRNTILLLTFIFAVAGIFSYRVLPKELFPDIVIPTVMVVTNYPGNPPVDIENLITRPLEKEISNVTGISEMRSFSTQDNSNIVIEFETGIEISTALQDVKDAVDRALPDLPADLPSDPAVLDIDFSDFPIMNINLSGEFRIDELKRFADLLQDEIELLSEISEVEITGIPDREIQINLDPLQMDALELSFSDIENAIVQENISMGGGSILFDDGSRWAVRTTGEFTDTRQIGDIIVKYEMGQIVYLRDIADVEDTFAEPASFARLDDQPVVSLQVIKKDGENLLDATAKISGIIDRMRETGELPARLSLTVTNDQSEDIRTQLTNLENSVILAVILVVLVLFLFLGVKNALFVGLAIPLSMLAAFMVLGLLGIQINMIVLFSLILALGLLVDNAIVVVDNIYRFVERGNTVMDSAKYATAEIAIPIITSTATTLSAFIPLAFWTGIVGEFMVYLPVTLIIVLASSLFVALVIIPVFSKTFYHDREAERAAGPQTAKRLPVWRRPWFLILLLAGGGLILHLVDFTLTGNIMILAAIIWSLGYFLLGRLQVWFRERFLPYNEGLYSRTLSFALKGKNSYFFVAGTLVFLVLSLFLFMARNPNVLFFPDNEPQYINILAQMPIGNDITLTDKTTREIEQHVEEILEPYRHIVKSVLTTVGRGATGEMDFSIGDTPHRSRITITFIDFQYREGINTNEIMAEISRELLGRYPGVEFNIEKNMAGPPTGPPINIEISGRDFTRLLTLTGEIQEEIERSDIAGIGGLSMDLDVDMPEIVISIDRERARRYGLSTAVIASSIRTALFGNEISTFKIGEEEFPIMLRLKQDYRYTLSSLMNQQITYRSPATGQLMQVPVSAVATPEFGKTYGSVNRIDMRRVITLSSNILPGYNANRINDEIRELLAVYELPEGYEYTFTGEQQEQDEAMDFLITALLVALALISLILVTQFNSVIKPLIIVGSVIFSTAGVFLGIALFNMEFVIVLTGIGIISLAGVVVNNGIVLVDYTDYLHDRKRRELDVPEEMFLDPARSLSLVQQAGETRFRPVILTAITTILGLLPLAAGLNINLVTLMTDLNPQIYFGGDNAAFWSPMAWTVIFGLAVATFLTLIIVPCMYKIILSLERRAMKWYKGDHIVHRT
jgi:multidrug efflux pump